MKSEKEKIKKKSIRKRKKKKKGGQHSEVLNFLTISGNFSLPLLSPWSKFPLLKTPKNRADISLFPKKSAPHILCCGGEL